tara:strand:+ start:87 stop:302 length:216 start_codon:yes stop_codon:yes gene_type:complete
MGKGQKTKSHTRKVENKTPIMCNVNKDCKNTASFDFLLATPDNKVKEMSGCDKCLIALQKSMNAVLLDGTK